VKSIAEIDFANLTRRHYTPSPDCWVFNTDEVNAHELYSTLNPNLRVEGDELRLLLSYTPESGVEPTDAARHALPRLKVERRHGVL
jgi:hypothetical protein